MKKALSFLIAALLLLCLAGTCWADPVPVQEAPDRSEALSARPDTEQASRQIHASSYNSTYRSTRPSVLAKVIAAAILGGIAGLIKTVTGTGKNNAAQQPPQQPYQQQPYQQQNAPAAQPQFYCKACGAPSAIWIHECPYCHAIGQMERIQDPNQPGQN